LLWTKGGEKQENQRSFHKLYTTGQCVVAQVDAESIRELNLRRRTHVALADIAQEINPILLGWLNYYGAYTPSALRPIWHYVNATLVVWVMRKYKRYRGAKIQAGRLIEVIAVKRRRLFVHWKLGVTGMFA